jgi:hypothetical protein
MLSFSGSVASGSFRDKSNSPVFATVEIIAGNSETNLGGLFWKAKMSCGRIFTLNLKLAFVPA